MSARDLGNETAFPGQPLNGIGHPCGAFNNGLTKRELFAAMCMQGLLACPLSDWKDADPSVMEQYKGREMGFFFADQSVKYADALLTELAKEPQA